MTKSTASILDGFLADEPFDLDWSDVRARSEEIGLSDVGGAAFPRWRTVTLRWRIGIAAAIAVATIGPLAAFAFGLVFGGTSPGHPVMQSGPIAVALPLTSPHWTAAATSARFQIAGARRQVSIVIAGDFALPHPLRADVTPVPPVGRLAISVRHFPAEGVSLRWQVVKAIRLSSTEHRQLVAVHLRLGAEAVLIEVRFGSSPTREQVALANSFLAGIQNNGE